MSDENEFIGTMLTRASIIFIGAFAAILMSYTALALLPKFQLMTIEPTPGKVDYTAEQLRGRAVYISDGCIYCHSQQVRPAGFGSDIERGWGHRGSLPGDYVFDDPHLLGTMRTGPDLHDIGQRSPSVNWHLAHLYNPRSVSPGSVMPAYPYLFEVRETSNVLPSEVTVPLSPEFAPGPGKAVIARQEALDLYAYLMILQLGSSNAQAIN